MTTRTELTTTVPRRSRRFVWLGVALGVATSGWLLWVYQDAPTRTTKAAAKSDTPTNLRVAIATKIPKAPTPITLSTIKPAIDQHPAALLDDVEPADHERPHSHPIDDKRRRIYRENNLHAALMGAMNIGDHLGLRALIDTYRKEYPADEFQLQEGYSLVADCLERVTTERQNDARQYWQQHRSSLVRRFIRRHCLEQPVVNG